MKIKSLVEVQGKYEEWYCIEFVNDIEKESWKKKVEMVKEKLVFQQQGFNKWWFYLLSSDGHEYQEEKDVVWMTILSHLLIVACIYCLLLRF